LSKDLKLKSTQKAPENGSKNQKDLSNMIRIIPT
jgi:hypothetical protein